MFKLGKKIQTLVTYSNDVIYVLFRGEGSGKGNSKDLGRGDLEACLYLFNVFVQTTPDANRTCLSTNK